ncbi:hypothetical protein F5Y11DRAFT_102723 [Daldinia sp. FL1419]|nr:hypothetical protein F5Y11DRAFT_102723 [Daldinia sp. FL1419]
MAGSPTKPVRYRTSCDRCQSIKLRCSQDKPSCKRCINKGILCVYSPLRRMGRPKKVDTVASTSSIDESLLSPGTMAPTLSSGTASDVQREHRDSSPLATDFTGMGLGSYTATTPQDHIRSWDSNLTNNLAVNHQSNTTGHNIETSHDSQSNRFTSITDNSRTPRHEVGSWVAIPTSNPEPFNSAPPNTTPRSAPVMALDGPIGRTACDSNADCYTAILTRTSKLEQALNASPRPPPIDLALEAERDFRALHRCLFSCTGHSHRGRSCLTSDRPVLLSLSILAERVVSMFEENFRFAASQSSSVTGLIRDPSSEALPGTMARRLERSFRSLLEQPCIFPIPSANLHIRIGDFMAENPVKARVVMAILRLRIRKIQAALGEMSRIRQGSYPRDNLSGPLDWGDSTTVISDATRHLIQDLSRRMESLQGGMALMV